MKWSNKWSGAFVSSKFYSIMYLYIAIIVEWIDQIEVNSINLVGNREEWATVIEAQNFLVSLYGNLCATMQLENSENTHIRGVSSLPLYLQVCVRVNIKIGRLCVCVCG